MSKLTNNDPLFNNKSDDEDDLESLRLAALKTLRPNNSTNTQPLIKQVESRQSSSPLLFDITESKNEKMSDEELDEEIARINESDEKTTTIISMEPIHRSNSVDLLISQIENELSKLNPPNIEPDTNELTSKSTNTQTDLIKSAEVNNVIDNVTKCRSRSQSRSRSRSNSQSRSRFRNIRRRTKTRSRTKSPLYNRKIYNKPLIPIVVNPITFRPLSPRSAAFVSNNRQIVARRQRSQSSYSSSISSSYSSCSRSRSRSRSRTRTRSRSRSKTPSPLIQRRKRNSPSPLLLRTRSKKQRLDNNINRESSRVLQSPQKLISPIKSQNRQKHRCNNTNIITTANDKNTKKIDPVFEARRKKFEQPPIQVTANKIIKLKKNEPEITNECELIKETDNIDEILEINANSPLNILMSDDEISDEDNVARFKLSNQDDKINKNKSSVTAITTTTAAAATTATTTITTTKTTNITTPSQQPSPLPTKIKKKGIVFPTKKPMSTIVAQVRPIKKFNRKYTPIVFNNSNQKNTTDSEVTSEVILASNLVSIARSVKKIDEQGISNQVVDLRQELKRKRAVRMNKMFRNELDILEAQNPNIKKVNGKKIVILKQSINRKSKLPVQLRLGNMTKITQTIN